VCRFILFLIYYPAYKKVSEELDRTTRSKEWTQSLIIAHVVGLHFFFAVLITICLLAFVGGPENPWTSRWASFLGITSVILATIQYVPQIIRTFKRKVCTKETIPPPPSSIKRRDLGKEAKKKKRTREIGTHA